MNDSIYNIQISNLLFILIPVIMVVAIYVKWSLPYFTILYASFRMALQLVAIGFALIFIFEIDSPYVVTFLLLVMLLIASWIAIRPVKGQAKYHYPKVLFALGVGCLSTLGIVIAIVLKPDPWYAPRYLIPVSGMIFANAMNSVSLAAERFSAEQKRNISFSKARHDALNAALLPLINSFFAVGLVSLPGMMTGQILAGISPLIAVRYQIMVMGMLFGASGISSAVYLALLKKETRSKSARSN